MGANPGPHQIIRREAVEDSAEKPLDVVVDLSLQTEKRMRGHDPGWNDRGNQGEPVGGGRDIAVGEPCPRE